MVLSVFHALTDKFFSPLSSNLLPLILEKQTDQFDGLMSPWVKLRDDRPRIDATSQQVCQG